MVYPLHRNANKKTICNLFLECGKIVDIELLDNPESWRFSHFSKDTKICPDLYERYALIKFSDQKSMRNALMLSGLIIRNFSFRVTKVNFE